MYMVSTQQHFYGIRIYGEHANVDSVTRAINESLPHRLIDVDYKMSI